MATAYNTFATLNNKLFPIDSLKPNSWSQEFRKMKILKSRKARFVEHQAEIHCAKYGLSIKEHLFTGGMVGDLRIYFNFVLTVLDTFHNYLLVASNSHDSTLE